MKLTVKCLKVRLGVNRCFQSSVSGRLGKVEALAFYMVWSCARA